MFTPSEMGSEQPVMRATLRSSSVIVFVFVWGTWATANHGAGQLCTHPAACWLPPAQL